MDVKQQKKYRQLLEGITPCHILMILKLYLEKIKIRIVKRQLTYYFLKKPRFTYNSIKVVTIPNNYCNLYYSASERPNNIRAFLYSTYNG